MCNYEGIAVRQIPRNEAPIRPTSRFRTYMLSLFNLLLSVERFSLIPLILVSVLALGLAIQTELFEFSLPNSNVFFLSNQLVTYIDLQTYFILTTNEVLRQIDANCVYNVVEKTAILQVLLGINARSTTPTTYDVYLRPPLYTTIRTLY